MKRLILVFLCFPWVLHGQGTSNQAYSATISPIPPSISLMMRKYTWHQGCPVSLLGLRYIRLTYWGFDNKPHRGELIVNKVLAHEVTEIFRKLYELHYPIESMQLMDHYKGNDELSMEANNTSAFNCRDLTGMPGVFSQHSYGRAIDINPKINPYVAGKSILPPNGRCFADRNKSYPGKITKNSPIYKVFIQYGWDWAGGWYDLQDYQHFEKRAHGKKRNPYGYHHHS